MWLQVYSESQLCPYKYKIFIEFIVSIAPQRPVIFGEWLDRCTVKMSTFSQFFLYLRAMLFSVEPLQLFSVLRSQFDFLTITFFFHLFKVNCVLVFFYLSSFKFFFNNVVYEIIVSFKVPQHLSCFPLQTESISSLLRQSILLFFISS